MEEDALLEEVVVEEGELFVVGVVEVRDKGDVEDDPKL